MRVHRWAVVAAVAAFLSTVPGTSQAVTSDTGLGIRLLDAPVEKRDDPRALVYVIDHVAPGATFTRRVEVSNGTARPRHVELYPDAATISGGSFAVAPGQTVSELTSWISMAPASLDLGPGERRPVTATFTVPPKASSGERYGVLLAEFPPQSGTGILQSSRVGIRVYLSVGPGGEPASNFTVDSLTAARDAAGAPQVRAAVHNTGGRALDMRGTLRLTHGPGGLSAGPFDARLGSTLAPGDTEPVVVPLDKSLPAGPWLARVDLQSDLLHRAATATITFPSAPGATAAPVRAKAVPLTKDRHVLVPVAASLIGLVLVALIVVLLAARRRRRPAQ